MFVRIPTTLISAKQLSKYRVAIYYELCAMTTQSGEIIFQPKLLAQRCHLAKTTYMKDIGEVLNWMIDNAYIKKIDIGKIKPSSFLLLTPTKNFTNPIHYSLLYSDELDLYSWSNLAEVMLVLAEVRFRPGNYQTTISYISELMGIDVSITRKCLRELSDKSLITFRHGYGCVYLDGGIKHA